MAFYRTISEALRVQALRPRAASYRRHLTIVLPLLVVISMFYVFMASAGTFRDLPGIQTNYYDRMCEGFRRGHLYIVELPSPQLLAQPDPFAEANMNLWLWDATLYDGKYYLYWGPVPALLLLVFKVVTGYQGEITDQWPTLLFMLGRFYAGAAILLALSQHVRSRQAPWIVALSIATFGLANPAPFIVARPHVYEAGLAAGQCFLLWGMVAAYFGLMRQRLRLPCFVLAGILWSSAIGSRVTLALPVPLLVAITALVVYMRTDRSLAQALRNVFAMGTPIAATLAGYAVYNYARFGSVAEFGTSFQVTLQKFTTDRVHVIPNLFSYAFAPLDWSCEFPFVAATRYRPLPPIIQWPPSYQTFELVSGLLITSPWCWLAGVALFRPIRYLWKKCQLRDSTALTAISTGELWALSCAFAILSSMAPVLGLWEASMRYSADAIGGLLIAASLAAFWLVRRANDSRNAFLRFQVRAVLVLLAAYTCFVGAFCSFSSYNEPFKHINPIMYDRLKQQLSICRSAS